MSRIMHEACLNTLCKPVMSIHKVICVRYKCMPRHAKLTFTQGSTQSLPL